MAKRTRVDLKRQGDQASAPPAPLRLGANTTETILDKRQQPMSRPELHAALDRIVGAWVAATCVWKGRWSLGDYRFLVFSIEVAPKTQVFVQLWSEPQESVSWEVSSGRWNPPADKWSAGERSERIAAFGFQIGGRAENFQREVAIQSRADVTSVSRTIVDILCVGFDYRGTSRLTAQICHESRAKLRPVLSSFTPEDVTKVFVAQGYSLISDNQDEDTPVLQFRTRGVLTTVEFRDRVPDQHLFEVAFLSCVFPSVPGDEPRQLPLIDQSGPGDEVGSVEVTTALSFAGGVTAEWLSGRVGAWTKMIVDYQQEIRRARRKTRKDTNGVVH